MIHSWKEVKDNVRLQKKPIHQRHERLRHQSKDKALRVLQKDPKGPKRNPGRDSSDLPGPIGDRRTWYSHEKPTHRICVLVFLDFGIGDRVMIPCKGAAFLLLPLRSGIAVRFTESRKSLQIQRKARQKQPKPQTKDWRGNQYSCWSIKLNKKGLQVDLYHWKVLLDPQMHWLQRKDWSEGRSRTYVPQTIRNP